jgi:signal transduction histidine kinase
MVERRAASPEEVSGALRAALDDMRLVIDSLDPAVDDLTAVLANVRERLGPRIERSGLRFEWAVSDLPQLPWVRAEHTLDVLRILQEAVANVLLHAKASCIRVATGHAPGPEGAPGVFLEIRDDGVGIDLARRRGRGLGNMEARARRLGGTLRVEPVSPGPGTRLVLWLPLTP